MSNHTSDFAYDNPEFPKEQRQMRKENRLPRGIIRILSFATGFLIAIALFNFDSIRPF